MFPDIQLFDEISGINNSMTVIMLDGKALPQEAVPLYDLPLGPHSVTVTASDVAGNSETVKVTFRTITGIEDLLALVERFARDRSIDKGIANSLSKKLEKQLHR